MSTPQKPVHAVWRADKKNPGQWLVFGPAWLLKALGVVPIQKADGSVEHRRLIWTSIPFDVDGVPHCYGRPAPKRFCDHCGQFHSREEVRAVFGGAPGTGAYWRHGEETCSCGGKLGKA